MEPSFSTKNEKTAFELGFSKTEKVIQSLLWQHPKVEKENSELIIDCDVYNILISSSRSGFTNIGSQLLPIYIEHKVWKLRRSECTNKTFQR